MQEVIRFQSEQVGPDPQTQLSEGQTVKIQVYQVLLCQQSLLMVVALAVLQMQVH
jgi:hypothetical protein